MYLALWAGPYCALFAIFSSLVAADDTHRYLFSFGDSYTWTGFNISQTKPSTSDPFGNPSYPGWTLDGGANWIGVLIHDLSTPNTLSYNFACPGATVNSSIAQVRPDSLSFVDQVAEFSQNVASKPPYAPWDGNSSAFAVWFGTNDINMLYPRTDNQELATQVMSSAFGQLDMLYNTGARRFVLLNMPPLDRTPSHLDGNESSTIGKFVAIWNDQLSAQAMAYQSSREGSVISIVDAHAAFTAVLDSPAQHGAPNASCWNKDGTTCLWYDGLHPGQEIQKAVAGYAHTALTNLGFYKVAPKSSDVKQPSSGSRISYPSTLALLAFQSTAVYFGLALISWGMGW